MTNITELTAKLKAAAQDEIMCREACDTSDLWQDEASPESVLALTEALEAAQSRIAELEARTLTVKLPKRRTHEDYVDARFSNADLAAIYNATVTSYTRLIEAACDETGIKLQIEGE